MRLTPGGWIKFFLLEVPWGDPVIKSHRKENLSGKYPKRRDERKDLLRQNRRRSMQ